jgi:mRNA (guanine-N7-)-methyltransferase
MWNAQTHYDRQESQSLRKRAEGPAAPLKRFHNAIKRRLIRYFAFRASRYLDVACGRGGDLLKWRDAHIRHVRGIDISPMEIREARRRCECASLTRAEFSVCADAADFIDPEPYDVVACMFAIHYFFESEERADRFLQMVSINLKPGGVFIGTFPDARRVTTNDPTIIDLLFEGPPRQFGSAYRCTIPDTVIDGDGSVEYLVYPETLVAMAERHGLRPVAGYDLGDVTTDARLPGIRHFAPPADVLSDELRAVSRLFATFAFVKEEASAA